MCEPDFREEQPQAIRFRLVSGLQSVGVFALLFVGGIMVLNGKTEIGIVVAFISGLDRSQGGLVVLTSALVAI